MALTGKGFFIWKIHDCEGGNPAAIVSAAKAANLSHVLIKIADGMNHSNVDKTTGTDYVPPLVNALHAAGIQAWGWHYIYGTDPTGEAWNGGRRARALGLDGYVIDAESEFKKSGMDVAARRYITDLRGYLGTIPSALSSFRFPSYQKEFPWSEFLQKTDFNMPQVYWEQAHNAGAQLTRSFREFQSLTPFRPYMATGSAYGNNGWAPTPADITEYLKTAVSLNIPAVNFYSWDYCRKNLPALWNVIAAFPYPSSSPAGMEQRWISALNARDAQAVSALYAEDAVHVTSSRTIQGREPIRAWYAELIAARPSGTVFSLTSATGDDQTRTISWSSLYSGKITRGKDTLGLVDGLITYHYSTLG
jgi:hypothetical protein